MTIEPGYSGDAINDPKEVERKWLINPEGIPLDEIEITSERRLYQAYVAIAEDGSETRVRMTEPSTSAPNTYELTVKTKGDELRGEQTLSISEDMYFSLSDYRKREGSLIVKARLTIPYENETIELDIYDGDLHGLVVAEVEFDGVDDTEKLARASSFIPPSWFGAEVTTDKRYKNQSLALKGLPE